MALCNRAQENQTSGKSGVKSAFARVAEPEAQVVPAFSICKIDISSSRKLEGALVIDPLNSAVARDLELVPTFQENFNRKMTVFMINKGVQDVYLKPTTRVGIIEAADKVNWDKAIQIDMKCNKIIVSCTETVESDGNISPSKSDNYDHLPKLDLDRFPGTVQQLKVVQELFQRHSDIFLKEGEQLSCTPTLRHKIRTKDDCPVSQPYSKNTRILVFLPIGGFHRDSGTKLKNICKIACQRNHY